MSGVTWARAEAGDRASWDAFVAERPEGDPLQCWAWGEAVAPTGERPLRLVLRDRSGAVRAVAQALVRRTTLGRTVLYVPHGPVWARDASDAPALLAACLAALRDAARRERAIVVKLDPRALPGAPDVAPMLAAAGLRRARHDLQARTTRLVPLTLDAAALRAAWHADARRLAGRAAREGVVVTIHRGADAVAVAAFHELLRETAARGAFRPRPQAFLERVATGFAPAGPAAPGGGWYLALAELDGRAIAGMAVPRVADRAYYLYGASRREPELRHTYGAYAAMAALLQRLADDGVHTFDQWGVVESGGDGPDPAWAGFSAFKRTFGGQPLRHPGTFDLVIDPVWYRLREWRDRVRSGDRA
ncbi:MAG TPA: peptidoglycan bridge formation glycyltransferase FemA/FemB family protein [Candidatus Sulfotelmatobacter sp.]|nr:peptidoglycan bridge formation glycyltransferase FemA/FemB family protein [Candidatus Sulfotelmatobacter sp.]